MSFPLLQEYRCNNPLNGLNTCVNKGWYTRTYSYCFYKYSYPWSYNEGMGHGCTLGCARRGAGVATARAQSRGCMLASPRAL